ncbi:MAG: asparagine synthase (glutamine-hydrolyzing) [Candidatus Melainabacteria bacterium]|nr:asparagine synthase (glutamine-hydrolyzing) [Candidatus Melainabacteria bacterium]
MCGITGIFNTNGQPASAVLLRRMTDTIVHRGPDGEGYYVEGPVALGHRRLAIIDLSPAGHQPMMSPDGRFVLTFNGEVYNFQTLRLELESLGHAFHSRTDTEVVLHAYIQWGPAAIHRLNGMFALAIWDAREQTLFLARDRYGIKPLYYHWSGQTLLFGSEMKALLAHPACKRQLRPEGLLEYLTFQNFLGQQTLLEDIEVLPPGCWMTVPLEAQTLPTPQPYWDFHFREPSQVLPEAEYLEELDRLFQQAVSRQLVSDVPVGAFLSGGMDSGSITAIAARQIPYIQSFTVGFDLHSATGLEMGFDERQRAELMSYRFKTEHYEMVLKAGDMQRAMAALAWHMEEPRVGQSYPNFYASRLASKFVKVCLSGAGGDELFAGYPWRYYRAVVNESKADYLAKYHDFWQRLIPQSAMANVLGPIWSQVGHLRSQDLFESVFSRSMHYHAVDVRRPEESIHHSLYFEAKTFLHGLLLMEDKLSMAHSLETRVPFLDNDLVDFAMQVPIHLKLGNLAEVVRLNENEPGSKTDRYFARTRDGKLLLRKVMQRYIPESITDAEKQGFSAPDASWFRGESMEYVRGSLLTGKARIYDYLDPVATQALILDHLEGRENRRLLIWSLLSLEAFLSQFLPVGVG